MFFDGTKVRANADIDSLTPRFAQAARAPVAQLFSGDTAATDAATVAESTAGAAVPIAVTLPEEAEPPAEAAVYTAITLRQQQLGDSGITLLTRSFSSDEATDRRLAAENQAQ